MTNYTNVFGNMTVPPSAYREQTLALTADTTLFWPYNYSGTGSIVAKLNKITSTGAYTLTLPSAMIVSNGEDILWDNTSAYTITLYDASGGTIATVAAGTVKYLYLTDNTTTAGTWRVFTFGTGTSAADASALAGYGTKATGSTLSGDIPLTVTSLAATATTASRGAGYVFTGGSVAFTLPAAVTATSGFYVDVKNAGTGTVTITPVGGDLVDGAATIGLNPMEACRIECSGTAWYTVGLGRSTIYQFTKLVKDLTAISSYTLTSSDASNKLLQFTGAPSAATTITVPAVVAIYYVQVATSNAYAVTLKTAAGTGVALAQNTSSILYCDGVNVVAAQTASAPAAQITITNDTATNATMYPVWVTANTGNLPSYVSSTKMSFNPSTGVFTVTGISLSGGLSLTGAASPITLNGSVGTSGYVLTSQGAGATPAWTVAAAGTVTAVSVASANGFTGSSSGGATPALTLTTSISGLLKGTGTALALAVSGTDIKTIGGASLVGSGDVALPAITAVSAITSSTTLTNASAGYQQTKMTAIGQAVTLPDATTISVGSPKYYIDNSRGAYPVGIRDSAGTLLMGIGAGGTAYASCESVGSTAGVWSVTGTNLEPGLVGIDNTFSATYAGTILKPFVALDANKSIHFLTDAASNGFYAVAVDKTTGTVGTPVQVVATVNSVPRIAFKITSTTAIVFYSTGSGTLISVVISLSSVTTLAIGTPSATLTAAGVGSEDFFGVPRIAQLDTTLYLVSWATATGAGATSVAAFQVSAGTTVTLGSTVNIIAANNVQNSTTTYALTTLTALVLYRDGAAAPYNNNGVVVSVTNANPPVCTVGTPAALTGVGSSMTTTPPASCLLSATKCIVVDDNNTVGAVIASVFTISAGTTVTAGTLVSVETGITTSTHYTLNSATRWNPHLSPLSASTALLWYMNNTNLSRAVVLSESGGVVTAGTILFNSISAGAANAANAGNILPQGTTEFVALQEQLASTAGYAMALVPHKIAGTTITQGAARAVRDYWPATLTGQGFARVTNGDYLLALSGGTIPIFRSNGDYISMRGSITAPIATLATNNKFDVAANRVVLLGGTTAYTGSAVQARLISLEIAA